MEQIDRHQDIYIYTSTNKAKIIIITNDKPTHAVITHGDPCAIAKW